MFGNRTDAAKHPPKHTRINSNQLQLEKEALGQGQAANDLIYLI